MITPVTLIPFTPFQKLIRQWENACAQNGAQVMLVDGVLDPDIVESAWQSVLRDLGLGRVHVEEDDGYSHEIWSGDPPPPLVSHLTLDLPICEYLQEQINRRFLGQSPMPYRVFALQQGDRCYLGIVYQQWVADSVSIRLLMREWFLRIFYPTKARRKLIDLPRVRTVHGPELGWHPRQLIGAAKHTYRWTTRLKNLTSFPPAEGPHRTSIQSITFAAGELDDLLMVTRAEGCTLNDLLMAALATAIAPLLPSAGRGLSIATSIDLRPYMAGDLSEIFAFALAYAPIVCSMDQKNRLDLAQDIGRQTRRLKDPDLIGQRLLLPRLLAWWVARQEPAALAAFSRKYIPVSATLADVNLNKSWMALYYPLPLRGYLRVSSPTPALPIAVTSSTFGDTFELIIATQQPTISSDNAARLSDSFASNLRSLVQSRPTH